MTDEYFESLQRHAVPLDPRAIAALRHSSLALDIYCWLAHRLHRVNKVEGAYISWQNLREQFGQEYRSSRDFKKSFRQALLQARMVYPTARVTKRAGGYMLSNSPPPIATR